jgi:starvation-inducible outer membrane lipoprotein
MKLYLLILALALSACASNKSAITASDSQVLIRQMQTRVYESLDKGDTLRSVLATLQDLGFVIDTADYEMATITATKLDEYQLRVTVTVRDRNDSQLAVRANARVDDRLIDDPATYQDFFTVLDKAIFLTRHNVD